VQWFNNILEKRSGRFEYTIKKFNYLDFSSGIVFLLISLVSVAVWYGWLEWSSCYISEF
jgi:hypothetical protein